MAEVVSVISNRGSVYTPSILELRDRPEPAKRLSIKPETFDALNKGLFGVVNEPGGTGWAAHSSLVTVCGKTGTAQVVGLKRDSKYLSEKQRDHAWFVAYAPYEKPEIALSVMVEHGGHGGSAAAPIAKRAIEAYIKSSRQSAGAGQGLTDGVKTGKESAVNQQPAEGQESLNNTTPDKRQGEGEINDHR
jgi:penicillin-binding protein 2